MKEFSFVDLFSGIGGFHLAMRDLGGKCVFASEIDKHAKETYEKNFGIKVHGDITEIDEKEIPVHDVLCAGFPCQTFSKAGHQKGLSDTRGTLFFDIERILRYHTPKYIILENVRNLVTHDKGKTWKIIKNTLTDIGYQLTADPIIISPHHLGIPQLRERVVILGIFNPNSEESLHISLPEFKSKEENDISTILENRRVPDRYYLNKEEREIIGMWDDFYKGIKETTIGFPIWVDFFDLLPSKDMPEWKKNFILKNNNLYENNINFIDQWLSKNNYLHGYIPSYKKMEWQAGGDISSFWEGIIQFRPSGVRVKRPDCFPALVAMVQVPIIGKYKRRITVRESARLQSFPDDFIPDENDYQAYKQFGNAVNVEVIKFCANLLFEYQIS